MMMAEEKARKTQAFWPPNWKVAAGLSVVGLGAWTLLQRPTGPSSVSRTRAGTPIEASGPLSDGESLEDALRSLESRDAAYVKGSSNDFFSNFGSGVGVKEAHGGSRAGRKQAKKAKRVTNDALDKLDGQVPGRNPVSEEEKEAARTKIREHLKKLEEGKDGEVDETHIRDSLRAMLGIEEPKSKSGKKRKQQKREQQGGEQASEELSEEQRALKAEAEEKEKKEAESHMNFVKLLTEERDRKPTHTIADVRKDFTQEYGSEARQLMCSGCKLISARLGSELSDHDVHDQESPVQMLAAKRKAIDATCGSLRHLHVVESEAGGHRFEAQEGSGEAETLAISQRLCAALLEDARFELLTQLIQEKVHAPMKGMEAAATSPSRNWERWLCAQRSRVCKRSEVRDTDEEEESEL